MTAAELLARVEARQAAALAGLKCGGSDFARHAETFSECTDAHALIFEIMSDETPASA